MDWIKPFNLAFLFSGEHGHLEEKASPVNGWENTGWRRWEDGRGTEEDGVYEEGRESGTLSWFCDKLCEEE